MILPIRQFQPQYMRAPRNFISIENNPICVEIGAGKGKHAWLFSQQNPQHVLFALERTKEKFLSMLKLQSLQPLENVVPIHADALPWMVHALYPQQVQQFFILYPNPEPHNPSQRWLNMPFFEFLLSRLKPQGQITLASNIPSYIDEAEQQLKNVWHLPYQKQRICRDSARTHFEIKYLARGEMCQQLMIVKPRGYQTRFDHMLPFQGHKHAE